MVRLLVAALAALLAAALVGGAGASVTGFDPDGTVVLDGKKVFPIVLAKGPDPGSKAPDGSDAFATVKGAGVTFLKVGPATVPWTPSDIADANTQDRAATTAGLGTWVNLSTVAQAAPGSSSDSLLQQVVSSLRADQGGGAVPPCPTLASAVSATISAGIDPAAVESSACGEGSVSQPN